MSGYNIKILIFQNILLIFVFGFQRTQTNQPKSHGRYAESMKYTGQWSSGLFECCTDCKECMCAIFCFPW
jgi:hypothetical protein